MGDMDVKWHTPYITPLFHNNLLFSERKSLVFPTWAKSGLHTLSGIDDKGLKSFED